MDEHTAADALSYGAPQLHGSSKGVSDKKREILRILHGYGASDPVIGFGQNRVTLCMGSHTRKLPLTEKGHRDNNNEFSLWLSLPEDLRACVIPCLGGTSEDMHFAKASIFRSVEEFMPYSFLAEDIVNLALAYGYIPSDCGADRYDQFGIYNKRLVVLDTGDWHRM